MAVEEVNLTKEWAEIVRLAYLGRASVLTLWNSKGIYFFKALLWVAFILFFTFTDLVVAAALDGISFNDSFYASQTASIALIVNLGLVVMLVVDLQISSSRHPSRKLLYSVMFAMLLAVLIYLHVRANLAHSLDRFIPLISAPTLSITMFGMFILTITYIKYSTLVPLRPIKTLE